MKMYVVYLVQCAQFVEFEVPKPRLDDNTAAKKLPQTLGNQFMESHQSVLGAALI